MRSRVFLATLFASLTVMAPFLLLFAVPVQPPPVPPIEGSNPPDEIIEKLEIPLLARAEWRLSQGSRAFALSSEDLDRDGSPELVVGGDGLNRYTAGMEGQISVWEYDPASRTLTLDASTNWSDEGTPQVKIVLLEDLDQDGSMEIISLGQTRYPGPWAQIRAWTYGRTGIALKASIKWFTEGYTEVSAAALGDLDSDGTAEVITGQTVETSRGDSSSIRVWKWRQGNFSLVWTSEGNGFVSGRMRGLVLLPSATAGFGLVTAHPWGYLRWDFVPGTYGFTARDDLAVRLSREEYGGSLVRTDAPCAGFVSLGTVLELPLTRVVSLWNMSAAVTMEADSNLKETNRTFDFPAGSDFGTSGISGVLFTSGYEDLGNRTLAYTQLFSVDGCQLTLRATNSWRHGFHSWANAVDLVDFDQDGTAEAVSAGTNCPTAGCFVDLRIWSLPPSQT